MSDSDYRYRVHAPLTVEEKRRRLLARRRYERRYRRIEQVQRHGPQFLMVLLCVLALALILYKVFGPKRVHERVDAIRDTYQGGASEQAPAADVRLDPEPFRAQVESFERALFGEVVARDLDELGSSLTLDAQVLIRRLSDEKAPRVDSLTAAMESIASQTARPGFNLEQLTEVRQSWLGARDRAFRQAIWFGSPAAEASADAGLHTVYLQAASSLLDLAESARDEAENIASALESGERPDGTWRELERGFGDQLRDIEWSLPEERPEARADSRLLAAIQKLETAIEDVGERVIGQEPSYPLRRDPYEEAIEMAREAIDAFDALSESQ